jgi:hypothetical protein
MSFPMIFAHRRGAIAGTLAVGIALGLSTVGIVRAERVKPDKIFKCRSGLACLEGLNSSPGYGVEGIAPAGAGVFGYVTSAKYPSYVSAGVSGQDGTGLGSSSGVLGSSTVGAGVYGEATSTGTGVFATSAGGNALYGLISGTQLGTGAIIGDDETSMQGVYANAGVFGYSPSGDGVKGLTYSGTAVTALAENSGGYTIDAYGDFSGGGYVDADALGNVYASGKIYTAGSCNAGCAKTKDGDHRVLSYTPRESLPSMEDTGESRVVDGHAYVRIDPALANVIDEGAEFSVFITPEGDCRGLYVTQKSSAGFAVREMQGGRSTLAFAYRIVAKPYADSSSRLPTRTFPIHARSKRPGLSAGHH